MRTAKQSYRDAWLVLRSMPGAVVITTVLQACIVVAYHLVPGLLLSALAGRTPGLLPEALNFGLGFLTVLVGAILQIAIHRFLLIGERPNRQSWTASRYWRFFGFGVILMIVGAIPGLIPTESVAGLAAMLAVLLFYFWLTVRISLVFAAIAVDRGDAVAAGLRLAKGNFWRLLLLYALLMAGPALFNMLASFTIAASPHMLAASVAVLTLPTVAGWVLGTSAAANAFRALTEVPEASEATPASQAPQPA